MIRPAKRVIEYTVDKEVTMRDVREIVTETEGVDPEATFKIRPLGGQLDGDSSYLVTITEGR